MIYYTDDIHREVCVVCWWRCVLCVGGRVYCVLCVGGGVRTRLHHMLFNGGSVVIREEEEEEDSIGSSFSSGSTD